MIEIDGYGVCVLIARGGMGAVYRSTRLSTGAEVAIKVLHQVGDESAAWRRTRRELAALVELAGHAHVIGVLEVHDLAQGPALVTEYAPGGSLVDLVARRCTPLSVGEAALIGEHAAEALIAAHARGIVHRDVKPHNLLIDRFGQVKLCDFGIASLARSHEFRQHTHSVSLRYASPEDLEGDDAVGSKTDIYSLGATLLHLVHGAPPRMRDRMVSWEPPVGARGSDVEALNAVIAECLQIDPDDRPEALEVFHLLEQLPFAGAPRCRAIASAAATPTPDDDLLSTLADREEWKSSADLSQLLGAAPVERTIARPGSPRRAATRVAEHEPKFAPAPTRRRTARLRPASSPLAEHEVEFAPPPSRRRAARLPPASVPVAAIGVQYALTPTGGRNMIVAVPVAVLAVFAAGFVWHRALPTDTSAVHVTNVVTVDRPAELVELTLLVWPSGPKGECLVQTLADDTLEPVECSGPHDLQRVGGGELTAGEAAEESVEHFVNQRCIESWRVLAEEHRLMLPADVADVAQLSNVRSRGEPADSPASYQCFLGVPGSRLVGDALAQTSREPGAT